MPKVYEDRIVQARVIAVAEKVVRAEIFGVETSILARDLSFDWMGDARERFQVAITSWYASWMCGQTHRSRSLSTQMSKVWKATPARKT